MEEYKWYFNGRWVDKSNVKIEPLDRGFIFGDTVFEVSRTFNGKLFRVEQHVDRLYRSLKYIRLDPGLSPAEMVELHEKAVRVNKHHLREAGDFIIHPMVTRGPGSWAYSADSPTVLIEVNEIDFGRYNPRLHRLGVHGVITRTNSYDPQALDAKIKHHSRMNFALAEFEANDVDPGAWPILTDTYGNITEGTGSNVFIVTDGVLRTPSDRSILQGVSRGMIFDLAEQIGIPVTEEELQPYDVYTSNEAFFTTTSPCIVPVTVVDNRSIGDGRPGEITKQILSAWSEIVGVDIVDQAINRATT